MLETPVLSSKELIELEGYFWLRHPTESCGVIIPTPHKGKTVFELPNRSMTPQSQFLMSSEDLKLELNEWFNENSDELNRVIFWHSHPSGDPKASKADRVHRVMGAMNLVISATDKNSPIQLYWY